MGLPMWRVPSPSGANDSAKADLTAAARSPIRRRRSPALRRTASLRRSDGLYGIITEPVYRRSALDSSESSRDDAASRSANPDSAEAFSDVPAPSVPLPPVPEFLSFTRADRTRARDLDETVVIIPDTWRDRRLRLAAARRGSAHSFMELMREDESRLPSYTPNFAPARLNSQDARNSEPLREWSSADFGTYGIRYASPHSYTTPLPPLFQQPPQQPPSYRPSDHPSADSLADDRERRASPVGLPSLRRIGRRAIADGPLPSSSLRESWSPSSTVDGLGDRERSFSPDPEWDTMLNTVLPDNTLPSADSSFTSAAASRSFSNSHTSSRSSSSNSASSSRTHLTVPSLSNPEIQIGDLCNDSTTDGSDTEPEDASAPSQPSSRRTRQSDESTLFVPEVMPPVRNPRRYARNIRRRSREASRFVRNYYSFTERAGSHEGSLSSNGRGSQEGSARASFSGNDGMPAADAHMPDPDLEQMRSILERFARRDDIPEEFWISAGLTRTMAQSVDRAEGMLRARAERMERSLERL